MEYVIYKDEVKNNSIESLLNKNPNSPPIVTANKSTIDNISSFLTGIRIKATFDNELKINQITLLDTKIKPYINNQIGALTQHFNIRASYIATIDKDVINGVIDFYKELQEVETKEERPVFNISQETNLQRALNIQPMSDNQKTKEQNISTVSVEKTEINKENKTSEIQSTKVTENTKNNDVTTPVKNTQKKQKSSSNIILLGAVAAILIIFVSILIGVKIMQMS